jgi:hypothetical protein
MLRPAYLAFALCLGCQGEGSDVPQTEPGPAVPSVSQQLIAAQRETACMDAHQLENALEMYQVRYRGACPQTLADLDTKGIVERVRADPWGEPFTFECSEDRRVVSSPGPDREPGTSDDVSTGAPPCAR